MSKFIYESEEEAFADLRLMVEGWYINNPHIPHKRQHIKRLSRHIDTLPKQPRVLSQTPKNIKAREYLKMWRTKNRAKHNSYHARYSHARRTATPSWYEEQEIDFLYFKCEELNHTFNLKGTDRLVIDHIIPLNPRDGSVCGLHCMANLQLLSKSENSSKSDTYETDW